MMGLKESENGVSCVKQVLFYAQEYMNKGSMSWLSYIALRIINLISKEIRLSIHNEGMMM